MLKKNAEYDAWLTELLREYEALVFKTRSGG